MAGADAVVERDEADEERDVRDAVHHRVEEGAELASPCSARRPPCRRCSRRRWRPPSRTRPTMNRAWASSQAAMHVDDHPGERQDVRGDLQLDARPDDGAQGEVEDEADQARKGHRNPYNRRWPAHRREHAQSSPCPFRTSSRQIAHAPEQPGVYLFLGRGGRHALRRQGDGAARPRCAATWAPGGRRRASTPCSPRPRRLEYVVTDSAVDALVLENNLIKQRLPRYNIRLRDDKNYPFLTLTTSEAFPRVLVARRAERDGNLYAGPFLPASLARRSISLAHRLFGLRSCNEEITGKRDRPVPRIRDRPLRGAVRRHDLHGRPVPGGGRPHAAAARGPEHGTHRAARARHARGGRGGALRARGPPARRGAHARPAPRPPAEDVDRRASATATPSA